MNKEAVEHGARQAGYETREFQDLGRIHQVREKSGSTGHPKVTSTAHY